MTIAYLPVAGKCDYCEDDAVQGYRDFGADSSFEYRVCAVHSFLFTCEDERTREFAGRLVFETRLAEKEWSDWRTPNGRLNTALRDVTLAAMTFSYACGNGLEPIPTHRACGMDAFSRGVGHAAD